MYSGDIRNGVALDFLNLNLPCMSIMIIIIVNHLILLLIIDTSINPSTRTDLFVDSLFLPGKQVNPERRSKYVYLMAYAVSVTEVWKKVTMMSTLPYL